MTDIIDAEVVSEGDYLPAPTTHTPSPVLRPAGEIGSLEESFREYQRICVRLLDESDYQNISGGRFRKKSGWRKLAVAYGLSLAILEETIDRNARGEVQWANFKVRATAPNGRSADGWGACAKSERKFSKPEHDIPATASTRAYNRAVSDLLGLGELSAEEVQEVEAEDSAPATDYERQVLRERIAALPQEIRDQLKETWPSDLPPVGWEELTAYHVEQIGSRLTRFERQAAAEEKRRKGRAASVAIACDEVAGPHPKDDVRHAIVHHATGGRTASAKDVTPAEVEQVKQVVFDVKACRLRLVELDGDVVVAKVPASGVGEAPGREQLFDGGAS